MTLISMSPCCFSQNKPSAGILRDAESVVEEAFTDFVDSRRQIPQNYDCLIVGEKSELSQADDGMKLTHELRLFSEWKSERGSDSWVKMSLRRPDIPITERTQPWNQILLADGEFYSRVTNTGTLVTAWQRSQGEDEEPEKLKIPQLRWRWDPYFLGFVLSRNLVIGYDAREADRLVGLMELVDAKHTDRGSYQGRWRVSEFGWYLTTIFASEYPIRPKKFIWSRKPLVNGEFGQEQVVSVSDVSWSQIENSDDSDQSFWAPSRVVRIDQVPGPVEVERKYELLWAKLPSAFAFPEPSQLDWREPFRELFQIKSWNDL